MPFKTLGEALYAKGFTRTGFYPHDAFADDPLRPKIVFWEFNPNTPWVDGQLHGPEAASIMDLRYGPGAFKAKGNPAGAWHGRESTWWVDEEEMFEFLGLDKGFRFGEEWSEEDLKYVCNESGEFAYSWLYKTYKGLTESAETKPDTATTKTPLDQRAEEVRAMVRAIHDELSIGTFAQSFLASLTGTKTWPLVKPFVVAALAAYRKVMEG